MFWGGGVNRYAVEALESGYIAADSWLVALRCGWFVHLIFSISPGFQLLLMAASVGA